MPSELKGSLVAFCNPLLDITASVSGDVLDKYTLKANDAILAEEKHLPLYTELVKDHPVLYTAGGSAQNAMRAAQWHLPAGSTVFVGCVGQDENGRLLRQVATEDGLQVEYQEDTCAPTGTCACLITDNGKSRSLVANLGAANNYKIDHIHSDHMKEVLANVRCIYISGFFLTVSPETVLHVAKQAHERGQSVCLNLSAPFICEFFREPLMAVLPYVDILFGNDLEAVAFAKADGLDTVDVPSIARHIAKRGGCKVVITRGCEPTIVVTGTSLELFNVTRIPDVEIVDTNGAGDAFVGGFLSQLVQGRTLSSCIAAGHFTAGIIIRRSGITFPTRPDVEF